VRGYIVGARGLVLRTDDGGVSWKDLESGVNGNLFGVDVASRNDVLVVGEQGNIIHSKDAGATWEIQPSITSTALFSIAYRGGNNVWIAGRGGAILRRVEPVATVTIPVSKLPPVLRGGSTKLEEPLDPNDIPRAMPPKKTDKPQ
ncbi:MAG TPA: YCF48-related protein, partial [Pyrinomonadaceae bacterium]